MLRSWHNSRALRARWLAALAFAAVAPKCLLCLAAYAGIGSAWFGAPELCGIAQREPAAWTSLLPLFAAATAALGFFVRAGRRGHACQRC